jgi:hypothetical protein
VHHSLGASLPGAPIWERFDVAAAGFARSNAGGATAPAAGSVRRNPNPPVGAGNAFGCPVTILDVGVALWWGIARVEVDVAGDVLAVVERFRLLGGIG